MHHHIICLYCHYTAYNEIGELLLSKCTCRPNSSAVYFTLKYLATIGIHWVEFFPSALGTPSAVAETKLQNVIFGLLLLCIWSKSITFGFRSVGQTEHARWALKTSGLLLILGCTLLKSTQRLTNICAMEAKKNGFSKTLLMNIIQVRWSNVIDISIYRSIYLAVCLSVCLSVHLQRQKVRLSQRGL